MSYSVTNYKSNQLLWKEYSIRLLITEKGTAVIYNTVIPITGCACEIIQYKRKSNNSIAIAKLLNNAPIVSISHLSEWIDHLIGPQPDRSFIQETKHFLSYIMCFFPHQSKRRSCASYFRFQSTYRSFGIALPSLLMGPC